MISNSIADTLPRREPLPGIRAVLERALDDAPSEIPPPRGWLRRLFARDRSARALVERYRLWPAIEHAYTRVTREYGPVRVEISAQGNLINQPSVWMELYGDVPDSDEVFEFESKIGRELWDILGKRGRNRFAVCIYRDYSRFGPAEHELRS
ncbi:MAG: hypothetical protein JO306_15660 [Gemmatimonadetes bacterium]|nr:hypothetical protein [Gemmatimonadota bacterium]